MKKKFYSTYKMQRFNCIDVTYLIVEALWSGFNFYYINEISSVKLFAREWKTAFLKSVLESCEKYIGVIYGLIWFSSLISWNWRSFLSIRDTTLLQTYPLSHFRKVSYLSCHTKGRYSQGNVNQWVLSGLLWIPI